MSARYACGSERRRAVVGAAESTLNGIDYVEVVSDDQRTLAVRFLHPLPGQAGGVPAAAPALTRANVVVEGGVRVRGVTVTGAVAAGDLLTITVDRAGDFSAYAVRLVTSPSDPAPPAGFDPRLSAVEFSFKAACESPFDCAPPDDCPPDPLPEPQLSYLAKDYESFLALLAARASVAMPDVTERSPADVMVMLRELVAHAADQLSYHQDAVATEAYLGTARSRVSVRRHARLLDYQMHDGAAARTWIAVDVAQGTASDGATLPAHTPVLALGIAAPATLSAAEAAAAATRPGSVVFETCHDLVLSAARSRIQFHTWSDAECCLPTGATAATFAEPESLGLAPGDVLVLAEVRGATTGLAADADPARRQAVRLVDVRRGRDPVAKTDVVDVTWHEADALAFPLCVSARVDDASGAEPVAEAFGNVVLADHGRTVPGVSLGAPERGRPFRPRLPDTGIAVAVPYEAADARTEPAAHALATAPRDALPWVELSDGTQTWRPLRELLGAHRFAPAFVAEIERDGVTTLRFGDGRAGLAPRADKRLVATYRLGGGPSGNVGRGTLGTIEWEPAGVLGVTNPLPASGGVAPEPLTEVRQYAPAAFKTQERAVTEADYARVAERHDEVQRAAARIRWTGSWYTAFVTVDRRGGRTLREDPAFAARMRTHLDGYRTAGYDVELTDPVFVPLDVVLRACVMPGYFRADVQRELLDAFSARSLGGGRRGFFHPDRFTFGQPLYVSLLHQVAMTVPGVESVELVRLTRFGRAPAGEIADGRVRVSDLEVIRLDNDPSFPERGRLRVETRGGL